MGIYLCRWPNGDVSVVSARTKDDANEKLDQFVNADDCQLFRLREFLVNFKLTDSGRLKLNYETMSGFGDATDAEIRTKAYPKLNKILLSDELEALHEGSRAYKRKVREAVETERQRLNRTRKKLKEGKTGHAKYLQRMTGASAVVADRWADRYHKQVLEKFNDKKTQH